MTVTLFTFRELQEKFNALSPEDKIKYLESEKQELEDYRRRKKQQRTTEEKNQKLFTKAKKEYIKLLKLRHKAQQEMETPGNRFVLNLIAGEEVEIEDYYDDEYPELLEKLKKEIDESTPTTVHPVKLTVKYLLTGKY